MSRLLNFIVAAVIFFAVSGALDAAKTSAQTIRGDADPVAEEVITAFQGKSFDEIYAAYANRRPQRPYPILKQLAISDCYAKLTVVDEPAQRDALRRNVNPLLTLFGADDRDLILFRGAEPNAFNLPGIAVGVSTGLLALTARDDELTGIAAHELAHEFFVHIENEKNFQNDLARQRQVELMCDAVAVAALKKLGHNPAAYADILSKILNYSSPTRNTNNGLKSHPALSSRLHVIAELAR